MTVMLGARGRSCARTGDRTLRKSSCGFRITSGSSPVIEDHFYLPFPARRPRSGDGLPVVLQLVVRAYECLQPYLRRDAECELEAARLVPIVLLDAIGVASDETNLFVPEGGQVECALRAGHADECDPAARARQAERVFYGTWRADTFEDPAGSAHDDRLAELGLVGRRA